MSRSLIALFAFSAFSVAACSSSKSAPGAHGDGGGTDAGAVDPTKKLSDLTPAEATAVCNSHPASKAALATAACTLYGLVTGTDQASCETARTACAKDAPPAVDCSKTASVNYATCSATVAELDACDAPTVAYEKAASCTQAGNVPAAPKCFTDLITKCPDLIPPPVDPTKKLSDLTPAEASEVCNAHPVSTQALQASACTLLGLVKGTDQASCEAARDACAKNPPVVDCSQPSTVNYGTCSATVAELEACDAPTLAYEQAAACTQAGHVPAPPQCYLDLITKCPKLVPSAPAGGDAGP